MTIQVVGQLLNPVGIPLANTTIRISALTNGSVLYGSTAEVTTDMSGNYDFNLLEGKFQIDLKSDKPCKYNAVAYVEVTDATPSPITLPELLENHAFCQPEAPTCPV